MRVGGRNSGGTSGTSAPSTPEMTFQAAGLGVVEAAALQDGFFPQRCWSPQKVSGVAFSTPSLGAPLGLAALGLLCTKLAAGPAPRVSQTCPQHHAPELPAQPRHAW